MLRQFPAALKLYDRALDITPNDPDVMASKASIYQAQGNLQEAARLLSEINAQTPSGCAFAIKITQLRLERNYGEAIRLLQARLAQFPFASEIDKAVYQCTLLLCSALLAIRLGQRLPLNRRAIRSSSSTEINQRTAAFAVALSLAYAAMGEKDSALKLAERAIMLLPVLKIAGRTWFRREPGVNSDDLWREQPCDLNSHPVVTNAIW